VLVEPHPKCTGQTVAIWNCLKAWYCSNRGHLVLVKSVVIRCWSIILRFPYSLSEIQTLAAGRPAARPGAAQAGGSPHIHIYIYWSLDGSSFAIILTPQTINSITITADDDITTKDSGQAYNINFVIALQIEEYDPNMTETGDPYREAFSRLKNGYGN
jgi:hypothetical protein